MTSKESTGALIGFVIGAVAGYLFFNDSDNNVFIGTVLPALVIAIAAAFIGFFLVRQTARERR